MKEYAELRAAGDPFTVLPEESSEEAEEVKEQEERVESVSDKVEA